MTKCRFEQFPLGAWLEMDRVTAAPTFFARPAWALAIGRAYPSLAAWPVCCSLDDGSRAIVPLVREHGGRLRWTILHGMPFGGYTVVLASGGQLVESHMAARIVQELLSLGDDVVLNLWPLAPLPVVKTYVRKLEEASVLDISGGVENALSRIGSKSRRMAGQARRRGVTCAIETGAAAIDTYYALLEGAAHERWHLDAPRLSKEFVRAVCTEGKDSVEVWIARFEGAAIAGGIALYGAQEVALWTTAMRTGMEVLRPHNILHLDIIAHAANRGIHWYNLLSSANMSGVLKFKEALGATSRPYDIVGRTSLRYGAVRALKRIVGYGGRARYA
jgi:hypothetical protein